MIIVTSIVGVLGMVILPIVLGFWLTRKFKLSWKLFFAGAATFIASQILHIPILYGLTALFKNGTLPNPPEAWAAIFNAVLLGLAAGIFEETARWVLYKFILKNNRTWNEGVLVGAGHGGNSHRDSWHFHLDPNGRHAQRGSVRAGDPGRTGGTCETTG